MPEPDQEPKQPYVRRPEPIDLITECPPIVFWVLCYLPFGVLMCIVFNSVLPLAIAVGMAYLTSDALDR